MNQPTSFKPLPTFQYFATGLGLLTAAVMMYPATAEASDRHFNRTYESAVLNPGAMELEPWTTWRAGRDAYFSRFDQRLEFEVGVVENLQTALYWNFKAVTADSSVPDATGMGTTRVRSSAFEFSGISSEWKYKLSDAVADAVGSALYGEVSIGPAEVELEAKVIVDKQIGSLLFAANPVFEFEWGMGELETEKEIKTGVAAGAGYFVKPNMVVGVELEQYNKLEHGELEHSRVSAGPSFAVASDRYWLTLSVLPQILAFKGASPDSHLDLSDGEYVQTRILMGFDL